MTLCFDAPDQRRKGEEHAEMTSVRAAYLVFHLCSAKTLSSSGSTSDRRWHLDLYMHDQTHEVERLITLGATRYPWRYRPGDDCIVLADPDDNLFCAVHVTGEA